MWKKIIVVIFSLLGTLTITYGMNNKLFANTFSYTAGGSVTGRVHIAPTGITGSNIGMQKGDKVLLGLKNPMDNASLGWQLIYPNTNNNAWLSMSSKAVGRMQMFDNSTFFQYRASGTSYVFAKYGEGNVASYIKANFNDVIATYPKSKSLIVERDMTKINEGNSSSLSDAQNYFLYALAYTDEHGKAFFTANSLALTSLSGVSYYGYEIPIKDLAFSEIYWSDICRRASAGANECFTISSTKATNAVAYNRATAVRPSVYLNMNDVVFAVSKGNANGLGTVNEPELPATYSSLTTAMSSYDDMKLRLHNPSMNATLNKLKNDENTEITEILKGDQLHIDASANAVNNSVLSAILFKDGEFAYYLPLDAVNNTNQYVFDTSGVAYGDYKIAVVNEVYDESSDEPTDSSLISNTMNLSVVEPLSLIYAEEPQNSMSSYEYSKNVASNTKIGSLTYKNGVGKPSLHIVAHPTAPIGHQDDYKNFEVSNSPTSSPVDVKITSNAPYLMNGSLKAGDYYFRIEGVDANQDPSPAVYQDVKITVNKTIPTLAFTTTAQKDMYIGETDYLDTMSTSNTDALSTSDVSYTLSGGMINVLSVDHDTADPLKYKLDIIPTHSGAGLPITFELSASIKETDNFKAVNTTVKRKIYVYNELSSLTWSPSKGSFSTSDVNKTNAVVGTLVNVNGVSPFTYEVVQVADANYDPIKGANNTSFSVSNTPIIGGTSVQVKTTTALSSGTYKIQFKVMDAKGKTVYTDGSILVSAKGQATFDFKDAIDGNVITSRGLKIKFDDASKKLIAEGGSTANPIQYDFAPSSMQPSGVDPSSYVTINNSNGLITPIRIGTIRVQATRPGDSIYDPVTTYMDLTIEPAPQTIAFNDISNLISIEVGNYEVVDAAGKITSNQANGRGGITYTSSNTSIATVEPITGKVTGVSAGNANIIATLNSSDASNLDYESNYDTVNATKAIKIYEPMKLIWNPISPNIKAGNNTINDNVGTISISDNSGAVTYAISTNSTVENADASFFKVVGSGTSAHLQLNKVITASDYDNHGGTFKVQVAVTDANGTQTIDISVQIDEADNEIYFTDSGGRVSALTKKYGENSNTFTLSSYSKNGGSSTYSIAPSDTSGTMSVTGNGIVSIHKAGTAIVQVVIGAGSGYTGGTITMPVKVEKGDQSIAFKDTSTLNQQFVLNATFQDPAELKESSKNAVSNRTITYTSNNPAICTIDQIGTITMLSKGTCDISASNRDSDWTAVTTNKKINLYDGMGVSFSQSANLQAEMVSTTANAKAGDITVNGGIGTKTYVISANTGVENKDASLFKINTSGVLSFTKAILASDLVDAYDITSQSYKLYIQIDTTDSGGTTITTDAEIEMKGAPLHAEFDTDGTGRITEEYGLGKTFTLSLSSNPGAGIPTYQIKNNPAQPGDVLQSVDASGIVTILHANDKKSNANDVMVEAVIPASNGYDGETIEVPVEITKAPQPSFAFKTPNIRLGHGSIITPAFTGQLSSGTITMSSSNNALASIVENDIVAKTTDGTVTITAIEGGDRDYKNATATALITISSAPAYDLVIDVPNATYGDTGLKASIILNDASGANQVQTWSSSNSSIADVDQSGNLTIFKAGQVTISCTQTSTGEPSVTATAIFAIDPKPITINIDNISKYVGEQLPKFNAALPTDDLVGSDTLTQPTFGCMNGSELVDQNTAAGTYTIHGTYPTGANPNYNITITSGVLTIKQDISKSTWYHLEGATSGTILNPTKWHSEDVNVVLDSASESAGTYDEISLDRALWDQAKISVTKEDENKQEVFFRISAEDSFHPLALSSSQQITVKIDKTKPVIKSITGTQTNKNEISTLLNSLTFGKYFKPGIKVSIESLDIIPSGTTKTSGLKEINYSVYEIDRTTGLINTTPKDTGVLTPDANNITEIILNDTGLYRVCATASDNVGNVSMESCSDLNVKKIDVDIDNDGENEFRDPDGDGCPDINIPFTDKDNNIYKINKDRDKDNIPDLDIDSDGDGIADINVDTDGDEKPDLNLLILEEWKPILCVTDQKEQYCTMPNLKADINVDLGGDKIPDLNIDTDGDYKADFNVSFDGKKAVMNVGIIHEWNPKKDSQKVKFEFDYMELDKKEYRVNIDTDNDGRPDMNIDFDHDGKPDINIDTDGNWIPDINIDTNGDGIADVNLDTSKDGKADENIVEIKEWKPDKDCDKDGFLYDTVEGLAGNDSLEDNNVIITKPGGVFLPNFALKVNDVTKDASEITRNDITNKANGQVIDSIYDIKLMKDGTQVQPDGTIQVRIPLPIGLKNPKLVVEQADGTYLKIIPDVKDGYLIFESKYLGKVAIVKDYESKDIEEKIPEQEPTPNTGGGLDNNTSVKGFYNAGANTGDETNRMQLVFTLISMIVILCTCLKARGQNK